MTFATDAANLISNVTQLIAAVEAVPATVQAALASAHDVAFWVDPAAGLDTNPGTQAAPLKTIVKAAELAPQGRRTFINVPPTALCDLNVADCADPTGVITIEQQQIVIQPTGGAPLTDTAAWPTIRFQSSVVSGQNISPHFQGGGEIIFIGCNVQYPDVVDTTSAVSGLFGISTDGNGVLTVTHIYGTILLRKGMAIQQGGGVVNLSIRNCGVQLAANTAVGSAILLAVPSGDPCTFAWHGNTLPSGVTIGQLINWAGSYIGTGGAKPAGLMSNVTSW